jgi:pimeloyl-ACP methyl ester carboxylesterase
MRRKKHPIIKTIAVFGIAAISIEKINKRLFSKACVNSLSCEDGHYHSWKHGEFFYKKKEGMAGRPLLVLHDLYPDKSAEDCEKLALKLSEKRTVYTMDLLGCGRSAKPAVTYSNFLYVLQVIECVKLIGQPVHLVAEGRSSMIAMAAAHYMPESFSCITLLHPVHERECRRIPDLRSRLIKKLIELPVIGTLAYHIMFSDSAAAHMGGFHARYLYASILGGYTNQDVKWMLKDMKVPVHVIDMSEKGQ